MRRTWEINQLDEIRWEIYRLGIVVDLTISRWGARAMLNPEDLGLESVPELVQLGHKKLMKKEYLARIDSVLSRTEVYILGHSFAFPFGNVRFVPSTLIDEVIAKMDEFKAEFIQAVEDFLTHYPDYHNEMIQLWHKAFSEMLQEHEGFVSQTKLQELLRVIDSKYPTAAQLRHKFDFDFVKFEIAPPKNGASDDVSAVYAKKLTTRLDGFLDDVVARLQGMVLETTKNIKERIEKGSLGGNTIKSFVRFAESFRKMDIVGMDIEAELDLLRDKLLAVEKYDTKKKNPQAWKNFTETLQTNLSEIEAKVLDADVINGRLKRTIEREIEA